jgi:hypothetical protein
VYYDPNSGTNRNGPSGGGPGLAGVSGTAAGGTPGSAAVGNSFITWSTVGDRRGPLN